MLLQCLQILTRTHTHLNILLVCSNRQIGVGAFTDERGGKGEGRLSGCMYVLSFAHLSLLGVDYELCGEFNGRNTDGRFPSPHFFFLIYSPVVFSIQKANTAVDDGLMVPTIAVNSVGLDEWSIFFLLLILLLIFWGRSLGACFVSDATFHFRYKKKGSKFILPPFLVFFIEL